MRTSGPREPEAGGAVPSLVVGEAQFKGPAHATVNAALLTAARLALPDARAVFLASPEHGPWVRRALEATPGRDAGDVEWSSLPALPALRRVGRLRRAAAELRSWWHLLAEARRRRAEALVICSLTRTGILALDLLTPLLLPATPVVAVVHQLNELGGDGPPSRRARRLSILLRLPSSRRLRFLAPAESVFAELSARFPAVARRFAWLDLPYFWQEEEPTPLPEDPGRLVFGFFGVGRRGRIEPFCRLAEAVRQRHPEARFVLVGHLDRERPDLAPFQAVVEGLDAAPLPLDELRRRAREIHYALWTSPEESYRMTLSASFLDALSFVKPCLFLDNPFVVHYWRAMGDIGYRCADLPAMEETLGRLLQGGHEERYAAQCRAILAGRSRFAPATAARALRRLLDAPPPPSEPPCTSPT